MGIPRERDIGIKTLADPIPIDTTDHSALALAEGRQPGRPSKLDPNQLAAARGALGAGQSIEQVAAAFDVSGAILYRYLAEHEEEEATV